MNHIISLQTPSFFRRAILITLAIFLVACTKDESTKGKDKLVFNTEDYSVQTQDALNIVSDLPAYIIPYEYKNFGAALINRLQNKVAEINEQTIETLASVVLHSSQIASMEDNWEVILMQLLTGRNIIIVEPAIDDFREFCDTITSIYILLSLTDEGQELLDALEIIPGARQTLEAFYDMSMDETKIESMFLLDTDSNGIFAEAIAVRGSDFHIVDRMQGVAEVEISHDQIADENGNTEKIETPNIESSNTSTTPDAITPYDYGLFADMFTKWINEQEYYIEQFDATRNRAVKSFNTRASENKLGLEDISTVQKVQYTINASTPYDVGPKLPVTVSFEICSIYMDDQNCDYYCVYKKILSYNQVLDCGPTEIRQWRKHINFGEPTDDDYDNLYADVKGWLYYPYYGPFMRDLEGSSICHANTGTFADSTNTTIELPDAKSIVGVGNASVVQYSPKNSIGSVDQTNGFSYGFDGGLYLAKEPSVSLGVSVSFDSSTTQTIDNLEIVVSSSNGIPKWNYIGHNLPDSYYHLFSETSHSEAPAIMRRECEVDQSWIWKIPNPSGSYRLFDQTSVTTSIMYYDYGFFKTYAKFANHQTTKRVSFLMAPPPRNEQSWMMNVSPYSDELNAMLATTHRRFWKKDDHEFKLSDSSNDSRISIEQFINDFQRDLNSKRYTWKNRKFTGKYTFAYYNIDDENNEPISFDFIVE